MAVDQPTVAYVWIWLPGEVSPIVAGRLDDEGNTTPLAYGRSYLARTDAIPLYLPELPLTPGQQQPELLPVAGPIDDAAPDAWGRRVVNRRLNVSRESDLSDLSYLLGSSSNRIGALDFQASPDEYRSRGDAQSSLDDLYAAAEAVDEGRPIPPALEEPLLHGTSIGGARPKATLRDGERELIAKFSSASDVLPVVKLEYVAMNLAGLAGLDVAPVELVEAHGRDVLLVERFDRLEGGERRLIISARTILRLGDMGIGASYADLASTIRERFTDPEATVHELFARMAFNVLVGNYDDHARNHAAFWDGEVLTLTPAYDIEPRPRGQTLPNQAMAIGPDGSRESLVATCVANANSYLLNDADARAIIDRQIATIQDHFDQVCDEAAMEEDRVHYYGRQFLNPQALDGY
jgi:serine/threonine-protein kinase HipA